MPRQSTIRKSARGNRRCLTSSARHRELIRSGFWRSLWRRRRDSNPRYAFGAYNGLANRRLQPLGHVSVTQDQRVSMRVGKNKSEIATGLPPHHRVFVSTPSRHANVIAVCPTPDRAFRLRFLRNDECTNALARRNFNFDVTRGMHWRGQTCSSRQVRNGPRKTSWSAYRSVHIQRRAFYRELYAVASLWASELLKGCTKRPTDHTIFTEPDCIVMSHCHRRANVRFRG